MYLPKDVSHIGKKNKVANCGVVKCDITQYYGAKDKQKKGSPRYYMDPRSIQLRANKTHLSLSPWHLANDEKHTE